MAYNPNMYMPYGYGYQPVQTAYGYQNQPMASAQPVNGLVSVTGIDGAKAYQLPPSSKMPLFDEHDDVLYLKTTDAAGYPTVKTFKFEPIEQTQGYAAQDYVTRDEYNELCERLKAIENQPRGCCFSLSVEYVDGGDDPATVPTPAIDVQNANLVINRIA